MSLGLFDQGFRALALVRDGRPFGVVLVVGRHISRCGNDLVKVAP
jgi:hypothetical protein